MEDISIDVEFEMDSIYDECEMHLIDDFEFSDQPEGSPPSPPSDVDTDGDFFIIYKIYLENIKYKW